MAECHAFLTALHAVRLRYSKPRRSKREAADEEAAAAVLMAADEEAQRRFEENFRFEAAMRMAEVVPLPKRMPKQASVVFRNV